MKRTLSTGLVTAALLAAGVGPTPATAISSPDGTITIGTEKYGIALMPEAVLTTDAESWWGSYGDGDLVWNSLSSGSSKVIAGRPVVVGKAKSNMVAASAHRVANDWSIRYGTTARSMTPWLTWFDSLSGSRAAVVRFIIWEAPGSSQHMYDVRTGRLETSGAPPWRVGPVGLFGNYLVYTRKLATATQVRRRDLATGSDVLIATSRAPVESVAVNGNLVAWHSRTLTAESVSYRVVGGSGVLGPVRSFATRGTRDIDLSATHLALDTRLVRREVRLVTLGSHQVRVIGTLPDDPTSGMAGGKPPDIRPLIPVHFDLDGNLIGWLDQDQNAKVMALGTPAARARYLGNGVIPAYFTPNGDGKGDRFGASLPFSKSLTRCSVTFRRGTTAVRTVPCLIRNGDALVIWDGRNSAGRLVPKGSYQWTLTGSDAAGPALWYTGSGARIGATVEVR